MSTPLHRLRARHAGILLATGVAFAATPVAAQAAVNLGTAAPFVVLGGASDTNVGASVLNGDLGVSPGTSLTGFGAATVNGVTHVNDATAASGQSALSAAYVVAAGQSAPPGNVLTGQDLGGLTLTPGTYRFASSAQLTGGLILNALGDPNAEFVFQIGSTLTTASASSVTFINGGTACNVYWQVGSSATLGSGTAFQGNVLASDSITSGTGSSITGRLLASTGSVGLFTTTISRPVCTAPVVPPPPAPPFVSPTTTTDTAGTDSGTTPTDDAASAAAAAAAAAAQTAAGTGTVPAGGASATVAKPAKKFPPASRATVPTRKGTAILRRTPRIGTTLPNCTDGFRARVNGTQIKRVVFRLDGKQISSQSGSPFGVYVKAPTGRHSVTARVTFKDATRSRTLTMAYKACSAAVLHPAPGPSQFTG